LTYQMKRTQLQQSLKIAQGADDNSATAKGSGADEKDIKKR